jgi:FMN reductase
MQPGPVTIVGLGGSLRAGSATLALLRYVLGVAAAHGASTELVDLRELPLPLYDAGDPARTPEVERLLALARRADGLVFATSVYHNTLTGAMKNALDYFELLRDDQPPYLTGRPVGLLAGGGGVNPVLGINTLEYVMRALRALVVWPMVAVPRVQRGLDEHGRPLDAQLAERVDLLGAEVVRYARLLAPARRGADAG